MAARTFVAAASPACLATCSCNSIPLQRRPVLGQSRRSAVSLLRRVTAKKHGLSPLCFSYLTAAVRPCKLMRRSVKGNCTRQQSAKVIGDEDEPNPSGNGGSGGEAGGTDGGGALGWAFSGYILAFWAAFVIYAWFFSPNQTPIIDRYLVERLLFFKQDEGYALNPVLFSLWNIMGVWPIIYCMLLIPTARSGVPIWPFTSVGLFLGAFGLLPYFGLWRPSLVEVSKEELDGWQLKILESKILATALAVAGAFLFGNAVLASSDMWIEFQRFFFSSRLTHITTLDFIILTISAPFWVFNDMEARNWSMRSFWASAVPFIPFFGPALYLILRPRLDAVDSLEEEEEVTSDAI